MTTEVTTERRRELCGEWVRLSRQSLIACEEDVERAIGYAPGPMTKDQLGMVAVKLSEARELLALIVP